MNKAQGQIWWANLGEPLGWRPVLILTRSDAIANLHWVTVAPLTRNVRGIPSEVVFDPSDGVPDRCAATFDNIATVERDLLVQYIASLSIDKLNEVFEAIHFVFDLPY